MSRNASDGIPPPKIFAWILRILLPPEERDSRLGDYEEIYACSVKREGRLRASSWYRIHVLRSIPSLIRDRLEWGFDMFKNMLKMLYRNFTRHKGYTLINVVGLALGMACCILIWIWIQSEWSMNRFHDNKDRLHRVYTETIFTDGRSEVSSSSFYPLARTLKESCPKVQQATRIAEKPALLVSFADKEFVENRVGYVDPDFFRMFSFPMKQGTPEGVFSDRLSVVLSESTALKYFGNRDPMGKVLKIGNHFDVRVTGIIQNMPASSSLHYDLIFPFPLYFGPDWQETNSWGGNPLETYVLLQKGTNISEAERNITAAVLEKATIPENLKVAMKLQPMIRIHLYDIQGGGLIRTLVLFGLVSAFVLLIACFNFINLTTARSANRAMEVGIRKVIGAQRKDLVKQFFGEMVLTSLAALVLALVLAAFGLPFLSRLAERELTLGSALNGTALVGLVVISIVTGLIAGGYPAVFLSSFRPASIIRGQLSKGSKGGTFRKVLIMIQFSISILLIITTLGVTRQLRFIRNMDLGLDRDNLLFVQMRGDMAAKYESMKNELLQHPGVKRVSRCVQNPAFIGSTVSKLDWDGKNPQERISMSWEYVDYDYFETMGMELAAGRWFSKEFSTDPKEAFIVNERAVEIMDKANPIGQRLQVFNQKGRIIGVVKNFHFQPLRHELAPLVIGMDPGWIKSASNLLIRIEEENVQQTLDHIRAVGKKFAPEFPFQPYFFSEVLDYHYRSERKTGKIISVFTVLAMLLSCLGLFGLASFLAEQRTKEIGIRKILGASASRITLSFILNFGRWVLLSNLIAWPLGYWFINRWLRDFAYRAGIGITVFVAAGAAAFILVLVTVGAQTLRAAMANPAKSLRYE